jgi:hypothetical protein
MPAPTTPYVTPALASILAQNMFRGQVPNANTSISEEVYEQLITWGDSLIEGWFSGVGYKIPFAVLPGETWRTQQTTILQVMSAVVATSIGTGYIPLPAPRMVPGRESGSRNAYAMMTDNFKTAIAENGMGFRAQYWLGKKAMKFCTEPVGPRTDFRDGYYDPTRYQLLGKFTDEFMGVFEDMGDLGLQWDYLYELTLSSSN